MMVTSVKYFCAYGKVLKIFKGEHQSYRKCMLRHNLLMLSNCKFALEVLLSR